MPSHEIFPSKRFFTESSEPFALQQTIRRFAWADQLASTSSLSKMWVNRGRGIL
jgi:hypothetical protein